MSTPSKAGAAIVKGGQEPRSLQQLIEQSSKELARALPDHMKPERLVRIALTCIRQNPRLADCTPASFLGALFTSAQLGLEPIAGRAYLIPFNNKRKIGNEWKSFLEVQFVVGYKGLVELFYRHTKAVSLSWGIVKENDEFKYELGTNEFLKHIPAPKGRGDTIGYWVAASLASGGRPFHFMSREDCLAHGKRHSKTYDKSKDDFYPDSPWKKEEDAMCLKTVLIQLSKLLPLSVELQRALEADETSRDFNKHINDALDMPVTTTWEEVPKEEADEEKPSGSEELETGKPQPKPEVKQDTPPPSVPQDPGKAASLKEFHRMLAKIKTAKAISSLDKVNEEIEALVNSGVLYSDDYKAIAAEWNNKRVSFTE